MKKRDLYYERIPTKLLREDFRLLGTFLGRVIKDQEGLAFFKIVEKFRYSGFFFSVKTNVKGILQKKFVLNNEEKRSLL